MATNPMSNGRYTSHRITVDEYYRMTEVGLLAPDARTELIDGEIIYMPSMGCPHAGTVSWLTHRLFEAAGKVATVRPQLPIRLDNYNEPEPDLLLARPRADGYRRSHPTAADILLLIEISDTTWRYDRETKVALYARYGVPEVWIVGLKQRELYRFRTPENGEYTELNVIDAPVVGAPIMALPDVQLDLADLFD